MAVIGCAPPRADDPGGSASADDGGAGDADSTSSDTGTTTSPDLPATPTTCDLLSQDCMPGDKCIPVTLNPETLTWNGTECVPVVSNPSKVGDVCETRPGSRDTCAPGLLCADISDATQTGRCLAFCDEDQSEACGDDGFCSAFPQPAGLCRDWCDPLAPSCGPDHACLPFFDGTGDADTGFDGFACVPRTLGSIQPPFPCYGLAPEACSAGTLCTPAGAIDSSPLEGAACLQTCDTTLDGSDCRPETPNCTPLTLPPDSVTTSLGVCIE